jgi:hypothetical protein
MTKKLKGNLLKALTCSLTNKLRDSLIKQLRGAVIKKSELKDFKFVISNRLNEKSIYYSPEGEFWLTKPGSTLNKITPRWAIRLCLSWMGEIDTVTIGDLEPLKWACYPTVRDETFPTLKQCRPVIQDYLSKWLKKHKLD